MRNYLSISQLQGAQGGRATPGVGWGATLKNFFAYFSGLASYEFCDFQNIVQK